VRCDVSEVNRLGITCRQRWPPTCRRRSRDAAARQREVLVVRNRGRGRYCRTWKTGRRPNASAANVLGDPRGMSAPSHQEQSLRWSACRIACRPRCAPVPLVGEAVEVDLRSTTKLRAFGLPHLREGPGGEIVSCLRALGAESIVHLVRLADKEVVPTPWWRAPRHGGPRAG